MKRHVIASHWGAGIAEVNNGRLIKVNGHPLDPAPSLINDNYRDSIDGEARVRKPAVRKGYLENGPVHGTNERGKEPFVEVSWDIALDLAAKALDNTRKAYGNEAIFGGSYGWASAGRFHHAQSQLKRFLNCTGGFINSEGNYSFNAALVLMPHIISSFPQLLEGSTRWSTIAEEGELVVMFGGMPLKSAQVSPGGVARHRLKDELKKCRAAGVTFINFSPLRSDAPEEVAAEWLAPIPGSDTAIMLGLAHTLLIEDLHDKKFLARYTVGFDKVEAYLIGKLDNTQKTAEWASCQSGIPAERIRQLARKMAASRTFITTAAGVQRGDHGEQALWMTVTLAAMIGQIGLPGGGFGIAYASDGSVGLMGRSMRWPSFPQGHNPVKKFIPVATIADMLLNPGEKYEYNGQQKAYPDIRLVWWAGGNPFHHHQDLNKLVKAFQQPETIIVNEISWTATARHADIVFPVTTALERNDIGCGNRDNALIPMPQIIAPIGEARDDYDIFTSIAQRLGLDEQFTQGKSSRQWLEEMWNSMRDEAVNIGTPLPDLDTFLKGDILELQDPAPGAVALSAFRQDPEHHRLETPSGKIELYSETIASFGYAECPGQATWMPPSEWLKAELAKAYPLHLISGQPKTRLHSQLDSGGYSQSSKIRGREPILMHPLDAKSRSIVNGDIVTVLNARGSCLAGVIVTDEIRENTVYLCTGAWFDPAKSGTLDKHGNPNVLTHDRRTSRLSQGPAAHSALVEVKKFEGELPTITAYTPPV